MKKLFLLSAIVVIFSSCFRNLAPFTENLNVENKWTEEELKRIQFYLSDDVIIHREITEVNSKITAGEVKMVKGKQIQEVVIKRGTPGILTYKEGEQNFAVSFEEGADDRSLKFVPDKRNDNRYGLHVSSWAKGKKVGKVNYDGEEYLINRESAMAFLMVDLKQINKLSVSKRTAKGRKIK